MLFFCFFLIGWGDKYGATCEKDCLCNATNGLCWPKGENGTGECLYCNDSNAYGPYCNMTCDNCGPSSEYYCDSGTTGKGCTKFDYGGIKIPYPYYIYSGVASFLLIIFFLITWCKTREHFINDDSKIPFFPRKDSFDEQIEQMGDNHNFNDSRTNLIDNNKNINQNIDQDYTQLNDNDNENEIEQNINNEINEQQQNDPVSFKM